MDDKRFNLWISSVLQQFGADLLRTKGILDFANEDQCFAFQAVHMMAEGDFIRFWKKGEKRCSRLVFIGRNLDKDFLQDGFKSCVAG